MLRLGLRSSREARRRIGGASDRAAPELAADPPPPARPTRLDSSGRDLVRLRPLEQASPKRTFMRTPLLLHAWQKLTRDMTNARWLNNGTEDCRRACRHWQLK